MLRVALPETAEGSADSKEDSDLRYSQWTSIFTSKPSSFLAVEALSLRVRFASTFIRLCVPTDVISIAARFQRNIICYLRSTFVTDNARKTSPHLY